MARESFGFAYPAQKDKRFEVASPQFSVGDVLVTSFRVLIRNLIPFGIITALIGIPYIVMVLAGFAPSPFSYSLSPTSLDISMPGIVSDSMPFSLVLSLTYIVTQCAINYGAFQDLAGKKVTVGQCLTRGLGAMIKVVLAAFFMSSVVGATVAVLVLICIAVPFLGLPILPAMAIGLIALYVRWWVFVPVVVVEGGFIGCFRRSGNLTKGNRWGILGLFLIVSVLGGVFFLVVAGLAFLLGQVAGEILAIAASLIFLAFTGVLTAVGYYKLRVEKEGISTDDLARVFD